MVSVIVPVYNVEMYLVRCIESIINQTYKDIEIILIDDGSKDQSYEICKRYADKYDFVKAIHIENHGVSFARNLGIEKSTGEYIQFVDSDDYIEPNMIELLLMEKKRRNTDIVLCGYYRESLEKKESFVPNDTNCDYNEFDKLIAYWTFDPIIGSPCNKLFDSKIIKKNAIRFHEGVTYAEDFCFCMDYYTHLTRFSAVPNALYHYRDTPNSLTKKNTLDVDKLWMDQFAACKKIFDFVNKNGLDVVQSYAAKQIYSYICSFVFYKKIRTSGILNAIRWLVKISDIRHKRLIKSTKKLSRMGNLNYVFRVVKFLNLFAPVVRS